MAHFTIITTTGESYLYEGSLVHAQQEMAKYGPGTTLKLTHPGTSGHGTSGIDY